jgi:uroporphyrinogen-III synthase
VRIVISPLLGIVPTGAEVSLSGYAGVLFTSGNAVALAGQCAPIPAYCVGAQTRALAEAAGWQVARHEVTAEALFAALINEKPATPLLHLAGQHRRGDLASRLTAAGLKTDECVIYDQEPVPFNSDAVAALTGSDPVIAPLFSPRTAEVFARCHTGQAPLHLVAISDAALQPVRHIPALSAHAVNAPTALAVKRHILELLRRVEAGDTPL